jgi:dihydroxyacid dehydratase/phosphogluconate dehydratase
MPLLRSFPAAQVILPVAHSAMMYLHTTPAAATATAASQDMRKWHKWSYPVPNICNFAPDNSRRQHTAQPVQ